MRLSPPRPFLPRPTTNSPSATPTTSNPTTAAPTSQAPVTPPVQQPTAPPTAPPSAVTVAAASASSSGGPGPEVYVAILLVVVLILVLLSLYVLNARINRGKTAAPMADRSPAFHNPTYDESTRKAAAPVVSHTDGYLDVDDASITGSENEYDDPMRSDDSVDEDAHSLFDGELPDEF
eukprot:m.12792 g.12792  ORF g.12792 m.12792 type:complete len:178 (-) comp4585_c0_seq1:21-554(-)